MKLDTASVIHNKAHSHLEYFQIILFKTIDTTGVITCIRYNCLHEVSVNKQTNVKKEVYFRVKWVYINKAN